MQWRLYVWLTWRLLWYGRRYWDLEWWWTHIESVSAAISLVPGFRELAEPVIEVFATTLVAVAFPGIAVDPVLESSVLFPFAPF